MELSPIQQLIAKHEGLRLKPYIDTANKCTIGYGRNLYDAGLTPEECLYLMNNDINRVRAELTPFPWFLKQPYSIQSALIDMCYNMGLAKLLTFRKMIDALNAKDYLTAAREALDSKWAKEVGDRATDICSMIKDSKP